MATTQTSEFLTLDWKDVLKGLVVAAISAGLTALESSISTGSLDWKTIGGVSLAAGIAYLTKNVFTPSQTVIKNG
jgi:hypothetical protein